MVGMVGVEGGGIPSHGHDAQDAAYPNKILKKNNIQK